MLCGLVSETQVQWWFLCSAKVASSQHPLHDILPYLEVCLVQWYFKGVDMISWAEETQTNLISISITWKSMVLVVYHHIWLALYLPSYQCSLRPLQVFLDVWKRSKHLWEVLFGTFKGTSHDSIFQFLLFFHTCWYFCIFETPPVY